MSTNKQVLRDKIQLKREILDTQAVIDVNELEALLDELEDYKAAYEEEARDKEVQRSVIDDALCKLLPGCQYMDLPDGGSVTPLEQVSRMIADYSEQLQAAEKRIAELEASANASLKYASELESEIESMQRKEHHRDRQSVIDALATSGEAWSDIEEYMQKWDAERAAGITVKGDSE